MTVPFVSKRSLVALLAAASSWALAFSAEAGGDPVRGKALLQERGCVACHSFDGAARQGPTYAGLVGKTRRVITQEKPREIVADEVYIRRSILEPNADIVEGYMPGAMPGLPVKPNEAEDLAAAILEIGAPAKPPKTGSLAALAAATLAFVLGHLGLSSLPVRRRMIGVLGDKGFQGAYSLLALGAFVWMIFAWRAAPHVELWRAPPAARWVPVVTMPIVFLLMVCGFSTKKPTSAGQEGAIQVDPRGIVRITRHPVLWSFAIWGFSHVLPNGDVAALCLFGGITLLAFAGMLHIDARRRVTLGEAWSEFAKKTSLVPFARGGVGAAIKEIGVIRFAIVVLLYVGMLHGHKLVIGVPALP